MIDVDLSLEPAHLTDDLARLWPVSGAKVAHLCRRHDPAAGSPVFTVRGEYTSKGWTEWTEGFLYGWALLQFDATGDEEFLRLGRDATVGRMASHITHFGVHDHGFNNISTYGALLRLMREGRIPSDDWERTTYEIALKASGAVQAARWSRTYEGGGFIHSFNGPHSLFADTMRTLRSLSLAHRLDHELLGENDQRVSLLGRMIAHARTTADYAVFYGEGRDIYDEPGRVAHESVFNPTDGRFRTSTTQQGYSAFTTWTRGQGWVMLGYPEQLEFLATVDDSELEEFGGRADVEAWMLRAARVVCDHYLLNTPTDGIPYWDTGAPGLALLPDHQQRPADPFNPYEPVDSSTAAIAAQALVRLGHYLRDRDEEAARRYSAAGLGILRRLLDRAYLIEAGAHQGLLRHGVYHRPRGWDYCPDDDGVPRGEAVMWGDYHLVEAAVLVQRLIDGSPYYTFFGPTDDPR